MKFWEALKAVDEGKTVQNRFANDGDKWWDCTDNIAQLAHTEVTCSVEWRIKPEPEAIYKTCRKDGTFVSWFDNKSQADMAVTNLNNPESDSGYPQYRPYFIKKFIEVVE